MPKKKKTKKKVHKKEKKKISAGGTIIALVVLLVIILAVIKLQAPEPAAKVNKEAITVDELDKRYSQIPQEYREFITKEMVLEEIIKETLLLQEAKRLGIEVSDEELEERLEQAANLTGVPKEQILEGMEAQNISLEDYRKQIVIYVELPNHLFADKINGTNSEEINVMYEQYLLSLAENATIERYGEKATGKAVKSDCLQDYGVEEKAIFYYADWCPHCENMKDLVSGFDMLWVEESDASVIKDCFPENYKLGFPQFICSNGEYLLGAQSEEALTNFVDNC